MNGIGGRTIAEAQERMSVAEFELWLKYREKYGGLNLMMRTEWAAAVVASTIANVNRAKNSPPFRISDFSPHLQDVPVSLEQAMEQWN